MLFTLIKLIMQLTVALLYMVGAGIMFVVGYFIYDKTSSIILLLIAEVIVFKLLCVVSKIWRAFIYGDN